MVFYNRIRITGLSNLLDPLAKSVDRSRTWVINQAVEHFLSYEEWFVREVESGIKEAEAGSLATHDVVAGRFAK